MTLSQLGEEIIPLTDSLCDVDISTFVGKPAGSVMLSWGDPSASGIYEIATLAVEIKKRKPIWDDQLCIDIATLALCHRAPAPGDSPAALFYLKIAEKNPRCWQYLLIRLNEDLPHLKGVRFLNADGTQNSDALKNFLCGSSTSAPADSGDATRLSLGASLDA